MGRPADDPNDRWPTSRSASASGYQAAPVTSASWIWPTSAQSVVKANPNAEIVVIRLPLFQARRNAPELDIRGNRIRQEHGGGIETGLFGKLAHSGIDQLWFGGEIDIYVNRVNRDLNVVRKNQARQARAARRYEPEHLIDPARLELFPVAAAAVAAFVTGLFGDLTYLVLAAAYGSWYHVAVGGTLGIILGSVSAAVTLGIRRRRTRRASVLDLPPDTPTTDTADQ
ncbi:hypothetical protein AB0L85_31120 [Streptomyces sp. NPDC052051]|uniref:hypothetical protein n=1 Tax=Streptomyces sp. NPDC052051 TaxID=3154649 RepID=UPI00342A970E